MQASRMRCADRRHGGGRTIGRWRDGGGDSQQCSDVSCKPSARAEFTARNDGVEATSDDVTVRIRRPGAEAQESEYHCPSAPGARRVGSADQKVKVLQVPQAASPNSCRPPASLPRARAVPLIRRNGTGIRPCERLTPRWPAARRPRPENKSASRPPRRRRRRSQRLADATGVRRVSGARAKRGGGGR